MDFIRHPTTNHEFGTPNVWDHSNVPCDTLPVTLTTCEDLPAILSYWKPTPNELFMLRNGASVCLTILGTSMPPVILTVEE